MEKFPEMLIRNHSLVIFALAVFVLCSAKKKKLKPLIIIKK